jgi:hypothetical protein
MAEAKCKATVQIGDSIVTFEGPPEFVEAQVLRFTNTQTSTPEIKNDNSVNRSADDGSPMLTEREFVESKKPSGHAETATVLGFLLTEGGQAEFTEDDVRRAYIRAGIRPPKIVGQALRDAKSKFDYITVGSKRGTYKLTNHGDRTVRFDLPRRNQ